MRPLIQYPIDMADRQTILNCRLKLNRQVIRLYIAEYYGQKPAWYLRHILAKQAKRINEIVKELYG